MLNTQFINITGGVHSSCYFCAFISLGSGEGSEENVFSSLGLKVTWNKVRTVRSDLIAGGR